MVPDRLQTVFPTQLQLKNHTKRPETSSKLYAIEKIEKHIYIPQFCMGNRLTMVHIICFKFAISAMHFSKSPSMDVLHPIISLSFPQFYYSSNISYNGNGSVYYTYTSYTYTFPLFLEIDQITITCVLVFFHLHPCSKTSPMWCLWWQEKVRIQVNCK